MTPGKMRGLSRNWRGFREGSRAFRRQPAGRCAGACARWPCGVGGCAGGVREVGWRGRWRQKKAVARIRTSILLLGRMRPTNSAGGAGEDAAGDCFLAT